MQFLCYFFALWLGLGLRHCRTAFTLAKVPDRNRRSQRLQWLNHSLIFLTSLSFCPFACSTNWCRAANDTHNNLSLPMCWWHFAHTQWYINTVFGVCDITHSGAKSKLNYHYQLAWPRQRNHLRLRLNNNQCALRNAHCSEWSYSLAVIKASMIKLSRNNRLTQNHFYKTRLSLLLMTKDLSSKTVKTRRSGFYH